MYRRTTLPALLALAVVAACGGTAEEEEARLACYIAQGSFAEAQERPSPLTETRFTFDGGEGLLCYGAVSARGREIIGGLLPFGQPERIGANEPTTIHLTAPAVVGGVELDAGSYSLYAVLQEDEWEFFVNANWERWGIPIDGSVRSADIGSFTVTPQPMDEMVETLRYRWEPSEGEAMGDVVLEWENTRVDFHVHPGG